MRIRQAAELGLHLDALDALEIGHLLDDLVVKHVARLARALNLVRQLLDAQLELAGALAARLLVVDAAHVLDLGAQEAARAAAAAVAGLQRVALRRRLVEVLGQLLVVELLLLARLEEVPEGQGVGLHVAQGADVVLVRDVLELAEMRGRVFDGGGKGVDFGLDARFEGDELLELLGEVAEVRLEVCFPAGDSCKDLFYMSQIIVQLVTLLLDLEKPAIRPMHLRKRIDERIRKVIKHARRARVAGGAPPGAAALHGGVPVRALEEDVQDGRLAQRRVEGQTDEEALQGVGAAGGEVGPEAVAADVLHALLVRQRGDGGGGVVAGELLEEEDKVGEAAADGGCFALEGGEGGLHCIFLSTKQFPLGGWRLEGEKSYVSGDEIRNKRILCAIILLDRRPDGTLQRLVPELRRITLDGHGMIGPLGGRREAGRLFLDVFAPGDVGEVVFVHDEEYTCICVCVYVLIVGVGVGVEECKAEGVMSSSFRYARLGGGDYGGGAWLMAWRRGLGWI